MSPTDDAARKALERTVTRNKQFEADTEALGRRAARSVKDAVAPGVWDTADTDARLELLLHAFEAMRPEVGLGRPVQLAVALGPDPADRGSAGFDEQSRIVLFGVEWVRTATWLEAVGTLAHELRHAWQVDLIDGAVTHEIADLAVPAWLADRERYDPTNAAMYATSWIEQDANDFSRAVSAALAA